MRRKILEKTKTEKEVEKMVNKQIMDNAGLLNKIEEKKRKERREEKEKEALALLQYLRQSESVVNNTNKNGGYPDTGEVKINKKYPDTGE